ncbi:CocE/NonD family hydrolase [Clostridium felsineum]|uniref:CocE/NonD family hydrolase n=1 Tax=Clostridium felsineum TaxID=36839 RepID=UPI00098CDF70|nr:CocE/NonD family hydrolase [Clostridium felsineum]URZ17593.1 hypothetical protein CLFE_036460 [Clostridium felsineum DSM 794]
MNNTKVLKGIFGDNVCGMNYETLTISGVTNENGEFSYKMGETVTFSIGSLILGSAIGKGLITPADLIYEVGGNPKKITNKKVTNMARFIQSLGKVKHIENGIVITDKMKNIIGKHKINFNQSEDNFTYDNEIISLFEELDTKLRSAAQARNHLRRTLNGIKKMTDVKIPTRDGSYLLADVFIPSAKGKYPVIMSHAGYGKAFWLGCIANEEDFLKHEKMEDNYFRGIIEETPFIQFHIGLAGEKVPDNVKFPPDGCTDNPMLEHVSENFEVANTMDWVPDGYVVIRVDGRGLGNTPGLHEQFSLHEAEDYYDAIEWSAKQPWSNGKVGLYGASYYAMNMYSVSTLQPPSLKAMIPIAGDLDYYRDVIYSGGGLYNTFGFISKHSCGEWNGVDFISIYKEHPFYDPKNVVYPCFSSDPEKINVPFYASMPIENPGIHTRGSSEAFIHAKSKDKKLMINSESGIHYWMYTPMILKEHKDFFDYWLKGKENSIMEQPAVKMMIRTGNESYYWQNEEEWPVASTEYKKLYLDVSNLSLNEDTCDSENSISYKADGDTGVTFITAPMKEAVVIAGYLKLKIWCSSTSSDMAVKCCIRVLDENDKEVPYSLSFDGCYPGSKGKPSPVAEGSLKVSHRKLDTEKSTMYRPYHTHLEKDCQLLSPGEVVECEVEIWPTTARLKKRWKLQLDIEPGLDILNNSYQKSALNTIYSGSEHVSYLQISVIPNK